MEIVAFLSFRLRYSGTNWLSGSSSSSGWTASHSCLIVERYGVHQAQHDGGLSSHRRVKREFSISPSIIEKS